MSAGEADLSAGAADMSAGAADMSAWAAADLSAVAEAADKQAAVVADK